MTALIAAACLIEWACYLSITLAIWSASQRRPIAGVGWLLGYALCSGWGRCLTAIGLWWPLRPLQTVWHLVTAGVGLAATQNLLSFTARRNAVQHLEHALQSAVRAIDAQQLVDAIPFPSAAMSADGGITAINEHLASLCGCRLHDVEGFRWVVYFRGRERVRVLANWVDFAQGTIECFYEESTWRRPCDRQTMQIATRGLVVGSQLVCSIADITHIPNPPNGGPP